MFFHTNRFQDRIRIRDYKIHCAFIDLRNVINNLAEDLLLFMSNEKSAYISKDYPFRIIIYLI